MLKRISKTITKTRFNSNVLIERLFSGRAEYPLEDTAKLVNYYLNSGDLAIADVLSRDLLAMAEGKKTFPTDPRTLPRTKSTRHRMLKKKGLAALCIGVVLLLFAFRTMHNGVMSGTFQLLMDRGYCAPAIAIAKAELEIEKITGEVQFNLNTECAIADALLCDCQIADAKN